jgi:osmotically-inducible protein OsmY
MPRRVTASAGFDSNNAKEVPMSVDNRSIIHVGGVHLAVALILAIVLILLTPERAAAIAAVTDQSLRQTIGQRVDVEIGPAGHRVDLDVDDGIVLLSGEVPHLMAKQRVQHIAESVIGVRAVVNTISTDSARRADRAIDEDVRSRIRQTLPANGTDVTVSVEGATVTLGGTTKSVMASRMAAQAAMSVKGVADVVNSIEVAHGVQRRDRDIKRDVLYRLAADAYLRASAITVSVQDGLVSLSGSVATLSDKRRAVRNVWVPGVTAVDDTALAVDWSKAMQAVRSTGRYVPKSDADIRQAIADALQLDPRTNALNIEVAVVNGAVTLSGIVDTLYASRAAEADALGTAGVWRVDNQLRVRYRPFPQDGVVKRRIEDVFNRDAELDPLPLDVAVQDNHVILTGTAETLAQKIRAENIASQIAGIAWLDNRIVIQSPSRNASDTQIAAGIKENLHRSRYIERDAIAVAVDDGHAVLTGRAADQFVVRTAVRHAFEGGAESVRTRLVLDDGSIAAAFYPEVSDAP